MNPQMLHDCLELAFEGKLTFPETIRRMAADGIERYHADLVRLEKTHYRGASSHSEPMPLTSAPAVPDEFRVSEVKDALAAIQQRQIQYPEFLRRVMAAGVSDYTVYLNSRKAIYTGRAGDSYVELFPTRP